MRKVLQIEQDSRLHCGASTSIEEIIHRPSPWAEAAHQDRLVRLRELLGHEILQRFGTFQERDEYRHEIVETVSVHVMTHAELLEYRRACRQDLIDDLQKILKQKRNQ